LEQQQNSVQERNSSAGTITKITFQKKRKSRRSVYIDGEYAFSISEQTFRIFPLHRDQYLSQNQIEVIKNHEEFEKTKDLALRYLAVRMRSVFELRRYLQKKECLQSNIARVIRYCSEHGYINDEEYAKMLIREMVKIHHYGRHKMYAALRKRGISAETCRRVLQSQVKNDDQIAIAEQLALKKMKTIREKDKRKEKIYRFLKQRGFSYNVISMVINGLNFE